MKKLLTIFSLYSLLFSLSGAHAYTSKDIENAIYLGIAGIIEYKGDDYKLADRSYRLDDSITRAEVAGIALKLRGTTLPEWYICKRYFIDTILNDWICRATELAADAGLVSRTNVKFRPQDKITRAEALAIIIKAGWLSDHSPLIDPGMSFIDANLWQSNLLRIAESLKLVDFVKKPNNTGMWGLNMYFYPNRDATRAEVFGFAKSILEYKVMMSGEVTL